MLLIITLVAFFSTAITLGECTVFARFFTESSLPRGQDSCRDWQEKGLEQFYDEGDIPFKRPNRPSHCWFTNRPKCEHTLQQLYSGMYSIFQQSLCSKAAASLWSSLSQTDSSARMRFSKSIFDLKRHPISQTFRIKVQYQGGSQNHGQRWSSSSKSLLKGVSFWFSRTAKVMNDTKLYLQ